MRVLGMMVLAGALALAGGVSMAPAALAVDLKVTMANDTYEPAALPAQVGDTITFVNDDSSAHWVFVPTVTHAFDLGKQEPGQSKVYKVGQPGRFEAECVIHPQMLMTVEVKP